MSLQNDILLMWGTDYLVEEIENRPCLITDEQEDIVTDEGICLIWNE